MRALLGIAAAAIVMAMPVAQAIAEPRHAIAMHGEPALGEDYTHLPYAEPDARKGGRIDYAVQGSFDSLNPFIVQGSGARGILDLELGNNVFETLMQRSYDEAFSLYPLIAQSVETDAARSFVEFTIDPDARFSDGKPVRAQDVAFTVELLAEKGYPRYATTARKIAETIVEGNTVRFEFVEPDRELPLILGLMPVLAEHAIDRDTFDRSTLTPMIGSGPYEIAEVRPGERLVLKRNPDYWAKDHPSKRGMDNYDEIRITYYRDTNTMFEAFKKGLIDIQLETNAQRWATGYDFPAVASGDVVQEEFETGLPSGMQGFVMNTRRPVFQDLAVRRALAGLFDFEWVNRTLLSDAYERTGSYYARSELSSIDRPASEAELALLGDFAETIEPEILEGTHQPASTNGSGRDRDFLRKGFEALKAAGYLMQDGRMVGPDGRALAFEIMLRGRNGEEIAAAWQRTLRAIGIELTLRSVDDAQYQQRLLTYDYDMILHTYTASLSPGVEQVGRWGSRSKEPQGTMNYAGVAEPAVDVMIRHLLTASTREDFVDAVRAYDRVLLNGAYVVPLYHQPQLWVAHWSHIEHPDMVPLYGIHLPAWWRAQ
ncbi:MAG: extracellular solute-binding protein [Aliihoeflea sp.]